MAEIKFKPIGPNILVKPEESEKKTKSGIIITEKDPERPQIGEIVALGEGTTLQNGQVVSYPFTVKVGDKVLFKKYGGNDIELEGEKYLVLTEAEILGIL